MFETLIAYSITCAVCAWLVKVQVTEDEKRKRFEDEKAMRLKYWLEKCAQSRKNDQDL